ncbi:MAG TPA: hypothetical protein PLD59_01615 [Tepidisphaeraceae bacterium]|nr:hypothetical protein [Tepidisphaeraceae bacterium]
MAVSDFILFFAWLLSIGGAISAALGVFVPRLGFDGHCRRCEYNISRRPRGVLQCPECGADLSAPRAIVLGRRRIHPSYLKYGLLALALGGPVLMTFGLFHFTGKTIDNYKPHWMLMAESHSGYLETELTALAEFQRRVTAKKLTKEQLSDIAAAALKRGGSRPQRIGTAWRNLYLSTAAAGAVKPDALRSYLQESLKPVVEFRAPSRAGDPVPFRIHYLLDSLPLDPSVRFREVSISIQVNENRATRDLTLNILGQPTADLMLEALRDMNFMRSIDRAQCFADPALLRDFDSGHYPASGTLKLEMFFGANDIIPVALPWQTDLEVSHPSAEPLEPVAAAELWNGELPAIQLWKQDPNFSRWNGASVGAPSDLYMILPKPTTPQRVPVSIRLRGTAGDFDCGVVVLDGTSSGADGVRVFVPEEAAQHFGDRTEARVLIAPADSVAQQFMDATARVATEMQVRVEVLDVFARVAAQRVRTNRQGATQPASAGATGRPVDKP